MFATMRNLTVKPVAIDSQVKQSTQRIGFIPKGTWRLKEADEYNISEVDWGEEPGYSWEDQNYGDGSEEDDQCRESRAEDGYEEESCRAELDSKPQDHYKNHTINKNYSKPWLKFTDKFYDYSPTVFTKTLVSFSGKENYSRREEDMENYFWEYKVPEHKKLSIALDTLVGEAYQWWLQVEECRIYFKEPTPHWEFVKELMYEHFEMRRLPPRTCPKRFVKLKPRQLHEREVTLTSHYNSYDQFRLYKFSGKGGDPRNYLQWEEDMERYFKCNSIPKGEYLSYGLGQLTEKAQRYWKREEKYREQFQEPPIRTWEQVKGVMRDRFAPYIPTQHTQKVKNISGTNMEIKEQEPNLAAQASSTLENSQVPTNDMVISELNVINLNYQNTGMMHLYSVQNVYEGLGNEETRPEAQEQENNEQSILESSTPADHALEVANTEAESMQDNQARLRDYPDIKGDPKDAFLSAQTHKIQGEKKTSIHGHILYQLSPTARFSLIISFQAQASGLIKGIFPQPFVATINPFKLDKSCCLVI
ncbi:hypothetical protein IGI04_036167 [Brassica rapa subsp. trilocularis]|uniref:Retrotransposon gag domain-containing protein n=1 Tax=Brassica rapa subsp. trilocularis TaxID=1813537 RepID=A0ABQ7LDP5_BRACM|nr:hypothetical protein IGI04_036167 [Brassica rapa subsp. trilocularis]